jgi:glc operon protein GlcG
MIEMTLEIAEQAARAAQAMAKELGATMTMTVVDEAGRLVYCAKANGSPIFSPDTSRAKAVAAAAWRARTAEMSNEKEPDGFWKLVPTILQGQVLLTPGGTPIVRGGRVIGAIGAAGGSGSEDQLCSDAGAAAIR